MDGCGLKSLYRFQPTFDHCRELLGQKVGIVVQAKCNSEMVLESSVKSFGLVGQDRSGLLQ